MNYITVKTQAVLMPRRDTPAPPPMSEDDLRRAMMADPAAKRRFEGGFASKASKDHARKMARVAADRRMNDKTTLAYRLRETLRDGVAKTSAEIADLIGGTHSTSQVSNALSKMRFTDPPMIEHAGKRGKLKLWRLTE